LSLSLKAPLLAGLLALSACGFTPLYGGDGTADVAQQLDQVKVQNIGERSGQLLRDALEDQLHAAGAPDSELYSLAVAYGINDESVGLQQDSSVTRSRFVATATWTLTPIGDPTKTLANGQATTENAANVIDQQYFALTLETNTINQQLADTLAQQIDTQLAAYFKTHNGA